MSVCGIDNVLDQKMSGQGDNKMQETKKIYQLIWIFQYYRLNRKSWDKGTYRTEIEINMQNNIKAQILVHLKLHSGMQFTVAPTGKT